MPNTALTSTISRWLHVALGWARVHPRRLLTAPRVEVGAGAAVAAVRIEGMVCGVCAARTRSALASVPGVETADVDLEAGSARLRLAPGAHLDRAALEAALQRAVDGVVVGVGARRWIERALRRPAREG